MSLKDRHRPQSSSKNDDSRRGRCTQSLKYRRGFIVCYYTRTDEIIFCGT